MARDDDSLPDPSTEAFQQAFAQNLSEVARQAPHLSLGWPSLKYAGCSAAGSDLGVMSWQANVGMYVDLDESEEERRLNIGVLDLFTLALDRKSVDALDDVSADTAAYLALFAGSDLSDAVYDQFGDVRVTGLLILDRAYVHPAFRGRDIGAWAVVQAVSDLTVGCGDVLVVACPTPTERRPGQTERHGAEQLAAHWARASLEPIRHCPQLVGQMTGSDAVREVSAALNTVGDLEIRCRISDLAQF
jgi:GNAT superfamily N-acetyltransferase